MLYTAGTWFQVGVKLPLIRIIDSKQRKELSIHLKYCYALQDLIIWILQYLSSIISAQSTPITAIPRKGGTWWNGHVFKCMFSSFYMF